jgi:RNase P subunit RPR2
MIEPEDGQWYVVVTCESCGSTVYLFRDLTQGKGRLDANYIVTCPRCHQKASCTARHEKFSAQRKTA